MTPRKPTSRQPSGSSCAPASTPRFRSTSSSSDSFTNARSNVRRPAAAYVNIKMTLTAPGCGMGDILGAGRSREGRDHPTVERADVELVFDPPWNQAMMSEEARLEAGLLLSRREFVKRLILLRHAKSSWDERRLADDRAAALSARGERDAPQMGARLRRRGGGAGSGAHKLTRPARYARLGSWHRASTLPPRPHQSDAAALSCLAAMKFSGHRRAWPTIIGPVGRRSQPRSHAAREQPAAGLELDNLPTAGMVVIDSPYD